MDMSHNHVHSRAYGIAMRVSTVGIIVDLLLSLFKLVAGILGHSTALVTDAIHGCTDVFSIFIVMVGVAWSEKGSDESHPYGHDKYEAVAGLILSGMLLVSGSMIGFNAAHTIIHAHWADVETPSFIALVAALVSIAGKETMFLYTLAAAHKLKSTALRASAWHNHLDALVSVGSLLGVLGSRMGFGWSDSVASLVIALFIIKTTLEIAHDSISKLDDHAMAPEKVEAMKQLIAKQPGVLALDDLKTRLSGNRAHVDVNIVVNGNLRVWQGHAIAHGTRLAIEAAFPEVKACMIHVNPDKEYAPEDEAVPHSANRQN